MKKNDVTEIEIADLTVEGMGVGRADGLAVFVAGAIPGERVRARIIKTAKSYCVARTEELLSPSPQRVQPPCPYFKRCGGCSLQHLSYEGQLAYKTGYVKSCLARIGGADIEVADCVPSPDALGYRNKAAFPVGIAGEGRAMGLYERRSHDIVDIEGCMLQEEGANRALAAVRRWAEECDVAPYDESTGGGMLRHVVVRTSAAGKTDVCLVMNGETAHTTPLINALCALPEVSGISLNINRGRGNAILGKETRRIWGRELTEELCGLSFSVSPASFLQVNRRQTEALYGKVLELAALDGSMTAVDLYCGTGTITLMLSRAALSVTGVEINPDAIADARANAAKNGITNAFFICSDVEAAAERGMSADVIVADPPRKGMEERVIEGICAVSPKRVVYVSCDPATLARDVARFSARGYTAVSAHPFDMFPQTTHVETCVLLSHKNS